MTGAVWFVPRHRSWVWRFLRPLSKHAFPRPQVTRIDLTDQATALPSPAVTVIGRSIQWVAPVPVTECPPSLPILTPAIEKLLPGPGTYLSWPADLYPFQIAGVLALIETDRLLLADEMGLGKTVQAIAAIRILWHIGKVRSALIVGRVAILVQWRRELEKWAPEIHALIISGSAADRDWQWRGKQPVKLVSYETLRSESQQGRPQLTKDIWGLVVLDEAQSIKNRDTDVSSTVKRVPRTRSWALTGTPLENKVDELASVIEFVDGKGGTGSNKKYSDGPELRDRHQKLQLRRRKKEVLPDLPEKHTISLQIGLEAQQRAAYDRAEREGLRRLREGGPDIPILHVLELITRLKQICNFEPVTGKSAKLDDLRDRLYSVVRSGSKAVVFSQFTDERYGVAALCRELSDFSPLSYTGEMDIETRRQVEDSFRRPDVPLLVVSLRAGGTGLNLQHANYVFLFDRWWNPAVEDQAEGRLHRIEQTKEVTVYKYTCLNTIEERIEDILAAKIRLFKETVDDVSIDLQRSLTTDDLLKAVGFSLSAQSVSG